MGVGVRDWEVLMKACWAEDPVSTPSFHAVVLRLQVRVFWGDSSLKNFCVRVHVFVCVRARVCLTGRL
mgnify:CR=1 FL=1